MHRQRGLTMIELVITIAIVTVLAVMVVPNLGRWIQHYRIRGAVREIVSQMELAKIKALKNNLEYRLLFRQAEGTFQLWRGNRPASSSKWAPEGGEFSLPKKVFFDEITFAKVPVSEGEGRAAEFNPHGTATGGKAILATSRNEKYTISVTTTTGKINTFVGEH